MIDQEQPIRVDKWLWAARFFKTRSLASQAVTGGKVTINGQRVKPAKLVVIDDVLTIRKGQVEQTVTVLGLASKRGPAKIASTLYEESADSILQREADRQERLLFFAGRQVPDKKPGKKDRRKIREFIRKT
jgi:ribosome-associated heat shock protein Hsp15